MSIYTVRQGESLSSIADDHGMILAHIYDAPENADFRKLRRDPALIYPGDQLFIPGFHEYSKKLKCEKQHSLVARQNRRCLRLRILNRERQPWVGAKYRLTLGSLRESGYLDSSATIEVEVPKGVKKGTLRVDNLLWPLLLEHLNPIDDTEDNGMSGIQGRLRNLGYDIGEVHGDDSIRSQAAIKLFQLHHDALIVDGIAGKKSKAMLTEIYGS